MCQAPLNLGDGTMVACHKCPQCRDLAIKDWAGRCIAEGKTSTVAYAVTLTYGRDAMNEVLHERAVLLTYSDVQKYLKLLRRHGYSVRYFVTGEYGSTKGRAHWHIVLFFDGKAPPLVGVDQYGKWVENGLDVPRFTHHRVDEKTGESLGLWWPHGFVQFKGMNYADIRYNCKYILKNMNDPEAVVSLPRMSKKPPLGARFFERMAEQYVSQGLAPQSLEYTFPEVRRGKRGDGEIIQFRLRDRSAELFLEHYVRAWERLRPGQHMPNSDLVEAYTESGYVGGWPDNPAQRPIRTHENWRPAPGRKPSIWETDAELFDQRQALRDEALQMRIEDGQRQERQAQERRERSRHVSG